MASERFKVKYGLAVGDPAAATIDGVTGDIVTNGDITLGGGDIRSLGGAVAITVVNDDAIIADTLRVLGDVIKGSDNVNTIELDELSAGDVSVLNALKVTGNTVKKSGGDTVLTFTGTNRVNTAGDILIGGDQIRSVGGAVAIGLDGANVIIGGNLKINGNQIKNSAGTTVVTMAGTATTLAGTLKIDGNQIKGSSGVTAITITGPDVAIADDLSVVRQITGKSLIVEDQVVAKRFLQVGTANADVAGYQADIIRRSRTGDNTAYAEQTLLTHKAAGGTGTVTNIYEGRVSYTGPPDTYVTGERTIKLTVTVEQGLKTQSAEMLITVNGGATPSVNMTVYSNVNTDGVLATFTATINTALPMRTILVKATATGATNYYTVDSTNYQSNDRI